MKKKILTFLTILSMVMVGCGKQPPVDPEDPVDPPSGETISFDAVKSKIINDHNYSAHIFSKFTETNENLADYNLYNIDDNVIFDDADETYNYGYIKQKNQGIVSFRSPKSNEGMLIGDLIATNTQLGMSDIYQIALEHVLDKTFTKKEGTNNTYLTTDFYAMAVVGNLGLGDYIMWASAPESISLTLLSETSFRIDAEFIYNYVSEEEGSLDDTFVQTPIQVKIDVSQLGTTRNSTYEGYVSDPDFEFTAPTEWDEYALYFFDQYFNHETPPFIDGLSYASKSYEALVEGKYYAAVEDYASGDLRSAHAQKLERNDYVLTDGKYVKTIEDTENQKVKKYTVSLYYLAPTDKDEDGMEYGFLYPQGVFYAMYKYTETSTVSVTNVQQLNGYLLTTDASNFIPQLSVNGSTRVSGFKDNTGDSNNAGNGDIYAFVAPNRTSYFNVHIEDQTQALNFVNAYKSELENRGFEFQKAFGLWSGVDDYGSIIRFTDVASIDASTWSRIQYVQMAYVILKTSVEAYGDGEEKVLDHISLSGYSTDFYQNSQFSFDGRVTAHYEDGTTKTVQPTSVSTPDMSSTGSKQVTVSYTEGTITKSASYMITVHERQATGAYTLTVASVKGVTFTNVKIDGSSKTDYNEGSRVTFNVTVESGYTLEKVFYTLDGEEVEIMMNPMGGNYGFVTPAGNVTISAKVSGGSGEQTEGDVYSLVIPMSNPEYYNKYSITLNDDGTGTYTRVTVNGEGTKVWDSLQFTYVIKGTNITVTYVDGDPTNFVSGYRLFPDKQHGTNDTGKINDDGSISFKLCKSDNSFSGEYKFEKEN